MRELGVSEISSAVKELCIEACYNLPEAVSGAIEKSLADEKWAQAEEILLKIKENYEVARQGVYPICQDTGMVTVYLDIGQDVHFTGGDLYEAVTDGVKNGYVDGFLRKSIVRDPLDRVNTNDNTPPVIVSNIVSGDSVKISVLPKGFGSENKSRIAMLKPTQTAADIADFVTESVRIAGADTCPPVIVGVGIGGTFDKAASMAKHALLRDPLSHNESELYDNLERDILDRVNSTGIGPAGLGGKTTALGVNIEAFPTHIAGLPVAVCISCHAARHSERTL